MRDATWMKLVSALSQIGICLNYFDISEKVTKKQLKLDLDRGSADQMVIVLAFDSTNLSLNLMEVYCFYSVKLFVKITHKCDSPYKQFWKRCFKGYWYTTNCT